MGITIHYDIKTKSERKAQEICKYVEEKAKKSKLQNKRFVDNGYYVLQKILDGNGKLKHSWWSFLGDGYNNKAYKELAERKPQECYRTTQFGVIANYPTSESFCIGFVKNKGSGLFEASDFTKTQVFNENEIGNVGFHVWIIETLLEIQKKFRVKVYVNDEGDYYRTDEQRLEHINYLLNRHKENSAYDKKTDKNYALGVLNHRNFCLKILVKAHCENLNIINGLGKKLKAMFGDRLAIAPMITVPNKTLEIEEKI